MTTDDDLSGPVGKNIPPFRGGNSEDEFAGASGLLFEQAMAQTRMAICLSDPHQPDQPILFVNRAFRDLTGYDNDEIIGRNCRFLQGEATNPDTVKRISKALADEDVIVVELLNYRKDGSAFWNALHLGPIYDAQGNLIYFFGSQWDVTDVHSARADERHAKILARELSHRMKNMFSVIGSIVNLTGRSKGIREEAAEINDRIQALGRAYDTTLDEASLGTIEAGQAIRSVLAPYDPEQNRVVFHGNGARVDPNMVSTLGLALHELAINAMKHGALTADDGKVDLNWFVDDQAGDCFLVIEWRETGGPPIEGPPSKKGSGFGIIETLLAASKGEIHREWKSSGLEATITVPIRRKSRA
ncbi:PAS domain-containing protein [Parvularcula sp. LCG005]|uniref:PAS domain-containing protein n=1 Tax=Parvularcula sp. LCG005 TaxID=3078805 RepID=UPI002942474D|nr:PAS domain-containing protein [Parvularcula sp. LCG005]WOI54018.1 PAS domain-containing protein [Parvularcula sp. LCG005]